MARGTSPRPKLRPEPSIGSKIMGGIKSIGSQIKSDFAESRKPVSEQSQDYRDRTAASKAAHEKFLADSRRNDRGSSRAAAPTPEEDMSSIYDENRRRYEEFMRSQQPQQPQVTPEMRREALNIFESQQGAGQMPYYMAAARGGPNASPAFNYAAQNYATLGGSQRLAPRPMEMMSVAERGQINDMAQAMADEQARKTQEEAEYRRGMDMVMRGGGKGGPRTGPQLPPGMVGLPRTPDYGGGSPNPIQGQPSMPPRFGGKGRGGVEPQIPPMRQPPSRQPVPFNPYVVAGGQRSPFASILASRFGGFGG